MTQSPSTTVITPSETPAPGASVSQSPNKPETSFGTKIEGIAREFSLHPVDVAIGIAGVLSNIAGPYAGLVDSGGGRIKPHLSLLRIGDTTSRLHMLEQRLFHPLRTRADWLRQRAQSHSRRLIDNWFCGSPAPSQCGAKQAPLPFYLRQRHADAAKSQEELLTQAGLNANVFDEIGLSSPTMHPGCVVPQSRSGPGAAHLPSLFFEGTSLEKINMALSQTMHREALLLTPVGGVFDPNYKSSPKDESIARDLVALLRGRDTEFPALHPDQGHGSFEHARVHLWASLTLDRLGQTLHDESSSWKALCNHCLLWDGSMGVAAQERPHKATLEWRQYDHLVHELLNARCFGVIQAQLRLEIPPDYESRFQATQDKYIDSLEDILPRGSPCIAQFCDLPARLLWVFLQLRSDMEEFWCGKAAFKTAQYAARSHAAMLDKASEKHTEKLEELAKTKITTILLNKGPCKMRDILRSSNKQSSAYFKPVLNLMERQGILQIDEQKRFRLVGPS
jgi:hypothetical protein